MLATVEAFIGSDGGEPGVGGVAFQEAAALEQRVPGLIVLSHGKAGVDCANGGGVLQSLLNNFFALDRGSTAQLSQSWVWWEQLFSDCCVWFQMF